MLQKSLRPTVLHVYTCTCDLKWNVSQSNQCFKNDSNRSLDKESTNEKLFLKLENTMSMKRVDRSTYDNINNNLHMGQHLQMINDFIVRCLIFHEFFNCISLRLKLKVRISL